MKSLLTKLAAGALLMVSMGTAGAADFNWRYVGVINPAHDYAKMMIDGFKRVEERTDGALHIDYVSYGETPYKAADALTLVRDGLVEMTEWLPGYSASTYPLLAGPELPFIMADLEEPAALQEATIASWDTPTIKAYKQSVLDDHNAVSLMSIFYDPINIWFSDVVTDMDGMKGKKVRATSPVQAEFLTAAGASPVNISAADAYTGLQRGVIDGILTGAGAVVSFKWDEVLKSGFATNVVMSSTEMLVSKAKLDELPDDVRDVLVDEMTNVQDSIRAFMPESYEQKLAQLEEAGVKVTKPSPELYHKFHQIAVEDVYPGWVELAGPDAEKILSDFGIELK